MTSSSTSEGTLGAARSSHTSFRMLRWLKTAVSVNAVYNQMVKTEHYVLRRLQVHQQQAERQKKSILQQTVILYGRAVSILQDLDMVRFSCTCCSSCLFPGLACLTGERAEQPHQGAVPCCLFAECRGVQLVRCGAAQSQVPARSLRSLVNVWFQGFLSAKASVIRFLSQCMLCQVGVCDAVWSQIRRHLQVHRQDASAFGKDTLLSSRWLLGSSAPAVEGIWHQVLQARGFHGQDLAPAWPQPATSRQQSNILSVGVAGLG